MLTHDAAFPSSPLAQRELLQLAIKKLRATQAREQELEKLNHELRTDRNWLRGQIDCWRRQASAAMPASPSMGCTSYEAGDGCTTRANGWTPLPPTWNPALGAGADFLRTNEECGALEGTSAAKGGNGSPIPSCARAGSASSEGGEVGGTLQSALSDHLSPPMNSAAVFRALSEVEETKRKLQALLSLSSSSSQPPRRRSSEGDRSEESSLSPQVRSGQSPSTPEGNGHGTLYNSARDSPRGQNGI